jgi:glutaredoxin
MKKKVIFYHAGCPVCKTAEDAVLELIDKSKYDLEVVHLAQAKDRIREAESYGVKSVPAMVLDNKVFHINFGAFLDEVKNS